MRWFVCLFLCLQMACRSEKAPPAPVAASAGVAPEVATGPYLITAPKLEAFVKYQRKLLEVQRGILQDVQALAAQLDGGSKGGQNTVGEMEGSLRSIERKARAEEAARQEAGLSQEDVNAISNVVTEVMGQRYLARALRFDEQLKSLEALQQKLPPGQRDAMNVQLTALREQAAQYQGLSEARRTHGDANVDAVLTREAALLQNYRDMLATFGGSP